MIENEKILNDFASKILDNIEDTDPDFIKAVDDHFWELFDQFVNKESGKATSNNMMDLYAISDYYKIDYQRVLKLYRLLENRPDGKGMK